MPCSVSLSPPPAIKKWSSSEFLEVPFIKPGTNRISREFALDYRLISLRGATNSRRQSGEFGNTGRVSSKQSRDDLTAGRSDLVAMRVRHL